MDAVIAAVMAAVIAGERRGKRMRVVTRRGSTMSPADLQLTALAAAKSIIVIAPEHAADGAALAAHESDIVVLKTLLAIRKLAPGHDLHVVAEILDERTESVARM